MQEYIQNNSQELDIKGNRDAIRDMLSKFHDTGLLLWVMEPALQFLNQDL